MPARRYPAHRCGAHRCSAVLTGAVWSSYFCHSFCLVLGFRCTGALENSVVLLVYSRWVPRATTCLSRHIYCPSLSLRAAVPFPPPCPVLGLRAVAPSCPDPTSSLALCCPPALSPSVYAPSDFTLERSQHIPDSSGFLEPLHRGLLAANEVDRPLRSLCRPPHCRSVTRYLRPVRSQNPLTVVRGNPVTRCHPVPA